MIGFRLALAALVFGVAVHLSGAAIAQDKETVAVIGTGMMGGALGVRFAELGYQVIYGAREPERDDIKGLVSRTGDSASAMLPADAAKSAEIIVLAVPFDPVQGLLTSFGDLDGKLIIDITNKLVPAEDGYLQMGVETSAGEMIRDWAPTARVVKAFNTVSFYVVADPSVVDGPVSVPVVGDDTEAKAEVMDIVQAMGLAPKELGPMRVARILEAMNIMYMVPYGQEGRRDEAFEWYMRPSKMPAR